jgi:hypothetical protein
MSNYFLTAEVNMLKVDEIPRADARSISSPLWGSAAQVGINTTYE